MLRIIKLECSGPPIKKNANVKAATPLASNGCFRILSLLFASFLLPRSRLIPKYKSQSKQKTTQFAKNTKPTEPIIAKIAMRESFLNIL
jgi:hypothetical protein